MQWYVYVGYDAKTGARRKGMIESPSPKDARRVLRQTERVVVSTLDEAYSNGKLKPKKKPWWKFWE